MTDLEMTKLCAEAMGLLVQHTTGDSVWRLPFRNDINDPRLAGTTHLDPYDPLHDDAQMVSLVKKFHLRLDRIDDEATGWGVFKDRGFKEPPFYGFASDLNRAVVECVAKMQASSSGKEER